MCWLDIEVKEEDIPLRMLGMRNRPLEVFQCPLGGPKSKHEFCFFFLLNPGNVVNDYFVVRLYVKCLSEVWSKPR